MSAKDTQRRPAGRRDDGAPGKRLFAPESLRRADTLRLGAWGLAAIVAVAGAILTANAMGDLRRASDAAQVRIQSLQEIAEERQRDAGRMRAAIDTLNGDRDRLFARLTIAEKTLFDMKDEVAKQIAAALPPPATVTPVAVQVAPAENSRESSKDNAASALKDVAKDGIKDGAKAAATDAPETTASLGPAEFPRRPPGLPLPASRPAAIASVAGAPDSEAAPSAFAIDLGSAKSIEALRTLWRGLSRRHATAIGQLEPLIGISERRDRTGVELRLLAGPFVDRDLASAMCATLAKAGHAACRPAAYDGQRLEPQKARPATVADGASHAAKPAEDQKTTAKPAQAAEAQPKIQSRPPAEPDRTAGTLPNPLEKLFGIGR